MQTAEFVLMPSKKLAYFLHGLYLLSILIVATLDILFLGKIILCALVVWFWIRDCAINKDCAIIGANGRNHIIKFWHKKGKQFVIQTSLKCYSGLLKEDSYKCPWFIILRLKIRTQTPRTHTIFIAKDALSPFEYKVLCARLLSY